LRAAAEPDITQARSVHGDDTSTTDPRKSAIFRSRRLQQAMIEE